jgi:hypothetical protein
MFFTKQEIAAAQASDIVIKSFLKNNNDDLWSHAVHGWHVMEL